MNEVRLAILLSGGGTTAEHMIKAMQSGEVPIELACVIASNSQAGGLERARRLGVAEENLLVIDPRTFRRDNGTLDREAFGEALIQEMTRRGVTDVTQNGWLIRTPENVIAAFENHIFNQHPGPIPDSGGKGMYGRRVIAAVLLFTRQTGREPVTVAVAHRVTKDYDKGPVVVSRRVPIFLGDTVDDLQKRVLPEEHAGQIVLLQNIVAGTVQEESEPMQLVFTAEEEELLKSAKEIAMLLYPHG